MSHEPMNKSRRQMMKLMVGSLAAVPVLNLVGMNTARAGMPHLDEATDPAAQALQYKHDATQANRTDKGGVKAADQFCHNCQFYQGDTEGGWGPCLLFPGKLVNKDGWCASWTLKQG